MEHIHIKQSDLIPQEEPSENESPEIDTDVADDAFGVSDSEVIDFEGDTQDDCLDAIFCQLINLYLRVGALCQRGAGQWVLKSLNSIANSPEEVQNASVVVVEIPYTLLNTIIPPYRNQVTATGTKKTRFKKSATVKFRKGLSKTAGFFVKTQPAPHKMHNSLAVLNFGRGKSAKFMYMASLDILSYRLLSLPGADRNVATQARIFATGLGPNCLMPQISALLSSKGLVGNPAMHVMDATGGLGEANKDKMQEQFAYALAATLGKRPIAPAPRAMSSGSSTGVADPSATVSSPRQQVPQANRPGQMPNNLLLNPLIQRQLQFAWYQNLVANQRNQKPGLQNTLMMRMMFPQGAPGATGEGVPEQVEGGDAAAAATANVATSAPSGIVPMGGAVASSSSGMQAPVESAEGDDEARAAAARAQMAHPMVGMMPRPFAQVVPASHAPAPPTIAPRGSIMSKLVGNAQKKVNQLSALQLIFELARNGFGRTARYLLAVCANDAVSSARELLMQVTEEQLEKFLQEDREQDAPGSHQGEFDQSLQIASALIAANEGGKEGEDAGATAAEATGKGKRRTRGKKGKGKDGETEDNNLLQQLAMAAAIAQKKDTDADEEGDSEGGPEDGDEGESAEETVGGLLDWLASAPNEDAGQPREYPWGRRGRASTAVSADSEQDKNGRGAKRGREQAEDDTENGHEASGEIEIDVQTGEIVSPQATESATGEADAEEQQDSDTEEPGSKRAKRVGKAKAQAKAARP